MFRGRSRAFNGTIDVRTLDAGLRLFGYLFFFFFKNGFNLNDLGFFFHDNNLKLGQ